MKKYDIKRTNSKTAEVCYSLFASTLNVYTRLKSPITSQRLKE